MKITKRVLSLFVATMMLFSLAVTTVSATDFSDVPENYQYDDAIQSLVARGIINGYEEADGTYTFRPENTITRAEFSKMVIYAIGQGIIAESASSETGFPDVSADHWAAKYISTAHSLKIINGFDDGTFKPDDNVTYDQALKMVVCAKYDKFGEAALRHGGYPVGYRKVAGSYGFIKGIVDGVYDAPAKRGTIAKLMDNMIGIDMTKITDDPTVAEQKDKVIEEEGQVTAIYGVALDGCSTTLSKYQIELLLSNGDTEIYNIKNLTVKDDLRSYLGKIVKVYYEEDISLDVQVLSSMTVQKNKNQETTVDIEDIVLPITDTTVKYENEDVDIDKIFISDNASVFYNGSLLTGETLSSIINDPTIVNSGSIRFLSVSGGDADVVFISAYQNYQVNSVNTATKTLYLNNGSSVEALVVNEDDKNMSITIKKNNSAVGFSSLAKNQILSISKNLASDYIEILIGADVVTGRVSAMTRDEGIITVNSKEYSFAKNATLGSEVEVGSNLKLYLDAFGKIAKYEFQASNVTYTYAYLTKFVESKDGLDSKIYMQVLNLNSTSLKEFKNYSLAEKVSINGVTFDTASDFNEIHAALAEQAAKYTYTETVTDPNTGTDVDVHYGAPADEVYQPIKYTLKDNKVDSILFGKDNATDADLKVNADALVNGIKCTTKNTGLANIYTLTSASKVLYVPSQDDLQSIDEYSLKTGNNSGLIYNQRYRLLLVDLSSAGTPSLVIVYKDSSSTYNDSMNEWTNYKPVVVTGNKTTEEYYEVTTLGESGEKVYKVNVDDTDILALFDNIKIGDIIRVATDSAGVVDDVILVAEAADIYNGSQYIKKATHHSSNASFVGESSSYAKLIREGNDNYMYPTATMSIMAGTVYSHTGTTFKIALQYAGEDDDIGWGEMDLGNEDYLQTMTAADTVKVVSVNFTASGSIKSVDETASIDELIPYTVAGQESGNANADRVLVYRSGSSAKLIVVFRTI